MDHRRTTRTAAVAAALTATVGAAVLGLAAPASAATTTDRDPADATASLNDLRRVVVAHGDERVKVKVRVTDLRRTSEAGPAGLAIFLDTDASRRGPEFRLGTGLQTGTDYFLVRMRNWRAVGEPLSCAHHVALDAAEDVVRARFGRACLDSPARVRVGLHMRDDFDGSHPVTDWIDGRRSFTSWVASA